MELSVIARVTDFLARRVSADVAESVSVKTLAPALTARRVSDAVAASVLGRYTAFVTTSVSEELAVSVSVKTLEPDLTARRVSDAVAASVLGRTAACVTESVSEIAAESVTDRATLFVAVSVSAADELSVLVRALALVPV